MFQVAHSNTCRTEFSPRFIDDKIISDMTELSKNEGSGKSGKGVSEVVDTVLYYVVDLKKQPPMAQLGVGAGFGTVTGYFVTKVK